MTCHIAVDAKLMFDGEDQFRTFLLVERPVVDKLVDQLILAGQHHLVGCINSLLIQLRLMGFGEFRIGLCPGDIYLRQQSGSCQRRSLAAQFGKVGGDAFSLRQVFHNLLIYLILAGTRFSLTLSVVQYQRNVTKQAHKIEIVECT